jgi:anti-anti-sigma factor
MSFQVKIPQIYADMVYRDNLPQNLVTILLRKTVKVENITSDIIVFTLEREPQMNGELEAVIDMTAEHSDCNVILNFKNVDIITSSSLTRLLKLQQTLLALGCQMVLCNIHPFTKSAFEVTGLDGVFTLAADKPAAMAVLRGNWPAPTL